MIKGSYGYIKEQKKKRLIKTVISFFIVLLIYFVGFFLNERSVYNIFTIAAVLMVLPSARALIGLIMLFPYRSAKKELYDEVEKRASDFMITLYDLVLTSEEKRMSFDSVIICTKNVYCFTENTKQDLSYAETFLKRRLKNTGFSYGLKLYHEQDRFVKEIDKLNRVLSKDGSYEWHETDEELKEVLLSMVV